MPSDVEINNNPATYHGGMITITDDAAHGTSFNIFLPAPANS